MSTSAPPSSDDAGQPDHCPVAAERRLHVLDVLRGFALLGILLANVLVFSGLFLSSRVGAPAPTPLDEAAGFAIEALVHAKFYSLFSFLFGIGFFVFLSRAEGKGIAARPLFHRRLWLLLVIGLLHAALLWAGDILTVYALLGFALVPFFGRSSRTLLAWAAGLLALPAVVYALMWAGGIPDPLAPPPVEPGSAAPDSVGRSDLVGRMIAGFRGDYIDVLQANLIQLAGRWVELFTTVRPPKLLGMFVLGLWVGQCGIANDLDAHAGLLRRVATWGLGLGLPLNVAAAWLAADGVPYLPGSTRGLAEVVAAAAGVPLLALGYAAGVALLMRSGRASKVLMVFAPVGRMALTNYLLQTVACMFVFYGIGLGLYGKVGTATAAGIALLIFALQVPLSWWWLGRYRFGPVEWAWRRMTYRTPLAIRRPPVA